MKHLHTFESFLNEAKLSSDEKSLYDKYARKVGWIMQSNDIRSTSGDVDAREKKYNVDAKETLFHNYSTKHDYDKDYVKVVPGIPLLYYGGSTDKESEKFLKDKQVELENLYNKREILMLSGDKTNFAKSFGKFDWLPKTVLSRKEAVDGAVGFPLIAKIKNGHSGKGIKKFDSAKELEDSKDEFDLYCQFIKFKQEFRVMFCKKKIVLINERVPSIEDDSSIKTKDTDEKIRFVYVYQDLNKVDKDFYKQIESICDDVKTKLDLDLWSLDVVKDEKGKLWVMETSAATGLGSCKMAEVYRALYEDFYGEELPDEFLKSIYQKYVVTGQQNYWPKHKKEIKSSPWAMDYDIITNSKDPGYRYFFNLKSK